MKKTDATTRARLVAEGKVPAHYAVGKADGDTPVQRWIGLLPDWQAERARRIDQILSREIDPLAKAVRYNGAWYGVAGNSFFLALNGLKRHLKVTFFDGQALDPPVPIAMKLAPNAALDLREGDPLDEAQIADWARQAIHLPGYGRV